jgi:pyruvate,water dikinase
MLRQGNTNLAEYRALPGAGPFIEQVLEFLHIYGHRAFLHASEFEAVRLADQPEMVLLAAASLLEEQEPPHVRAEAARRVSHKALRRMNPLRAFLWRRLLRLGSSLVELREDNRDNLELQNATYGLAARLLSNHHFPNQPSDHLWLYTFDEVVAFGASNGQQRVASPVVEQRRADLERHRRQEVPPELIWYNPETREWWTVRGTEREDEETGRLTQLRGIGASAGSGPVEGRALVTDSAEEAAKRLLSISGHVVLVTHVTDPVWSSLFRRLTAIVTEMGGVISHAATVARENGIPAVVGVAGATRQIQDGQWVRVDGAAGEVEIVGSVGK